MRDLLRTIRPAWEPHLQPRFLKYKQEFVVSTLNTSINRGGNKIWIFKPQVNFDVIPTYKHGGKIIFRFWDHLNPPHLRWSFRFFGDFRPFQRNLYIFINAGLEPKLFEIKSSTQQQSCKAHKIGQFCHQDQPSICLCSRLRNNSLPASSKMVEGRQWQILQIWLISTSPNPQTARLEH